MSEIINRIDADACVPLQLLADGIISRRKCKEAIIQIAEGVSIEDIPLPDLTTPSVLAEDESAGDVITNLRAELDRTKAEQRAAYLDGDEAKRKLATVTAERDRLREQMEEAIEVGVHLAVAALSAPPEPAKPLTPADRVMLALRSRDKIDAERMLEKMHPKPEAPKCSICGGPQNHQWTCGGTGDEK